jgi:hypothetical protein
VVPVDGSVESVSAAKALVDRMVVATARQAIVFIGLS